MTLNKLGGLTLIMGALLNILRMMPILLSDGITKENFPPLTLQDTIFAAQLPGYYISHVMVFISVPLLLFGFSVLFKELSLRDQQALGLGTLVGMGIGLTLYMVAAVIDGLILPEVVHGLAPNSVDESSAAGQLIIFTHEFAIGFGGLAAAAILITSTILGAALLRGFDKKILGYAAIVLGAASTVGYFTGLLPLNISKGISILGPLMIVSFLFMIGAGLTLTRSESQP